MKGMLNKIDKIFCKYFGLDVEIVSPYAVKLKNGELLLTTTESYKRHSHLQSWDEFNKMNLSQVSEDNKELLGNAIGKAIAKKLVISFDDIKITRELIDA